MGGGSVSSPSFRSASGLNIHFKVALAGQFSNRFIDDLKRLANLII